MAKDSGGKDSGGQHQKPDGNDHPRREPGPMKDPSKDTGKHGKK